MAITHSPFFDLFPKIHYDIDKTGGNNPVETPNIFFRLNYVKDIINNTTSYELYRLDEGDTPEIIAEKIYNDSGAGWMVLYANKIFDPQFDWPLDERSFEAYIIGKYGSVEKAETTIHHAEKTVVTENLTEGTKHTSTYDISVKRLTDNSPDVPFDYWIWREPLVTGPGLGVSLITADRDININSLSQEDKSVEQKFLADSVYLDVTVDLDLALSDNSMAYRSFSRQYVIDSDIFVESTTARLVTMYDYEYQLNESKKFIKVIKSIYYNRIMDEFRTLTGSNIVTYPDGMML